MKLLSYLADALFWIVVGFAMLGVLFVGVAALGRLSDWWARRRALRRLDAQVREYIREQEQRA